MSKVGINERATVPSRKAVRFPSPPIKTLEEDAKQQVFSQANELATLRIEYEALQARFDKVSALVSDVGVGLMTTNFGREYEERDRGERIVSCLRAFHRTFPAICDLVDSSLGGGTAIPDTVRRDITWLNALFAVLPKVTHK